MAHDPDSVGDILGALHELGEEDEDVSIGKVVEAFGNRSCGPFLLVPALIGRSPIGAVPGIPALLAVVIALFAVRTGIGRSHFWLPGFIPRRSVSGERLARSTDKLERTGEVMDRWFHGRLEWLTKGPSPRFAALIILVMFALVVPLEVVPIAVAVPFAVAVPLGAIGAFGHTLLVRDGLLMLLASSPPAPRSSSPSA